MAIDPVCRMTVSEDRAADRAEYGGRTYYFCGSGCRQRFQKDPEKYLKEDRADWIEG